jgi:hypothetical protein
MISGDLKSVRLVAIVAAKIANMSAGGFRWESHSANRPNQNVSQAEAAQEMKVLERQVRRRIRYQLVTKFCCLVLNRFKKPVAIWEPMVPKSPICRFKSLLRCPKGRRVERSTI